MRIKAHAEIFHPFLPHRPNRVPADAIAGPRRSAESLHRLVCRRSVGETAKPGIPFGLAAVVDAATRAA
jgi:hypothetical protein